MTDLQKYLSTCALAMAALLGGTSPAWAQAPSLGAASNFAVLSVGTETQPRTTGADPTAAVTLSYSVVKGDVGSAGAVTLTGSTINGNLLYSGALTNTGSTIWGTSTQPLPAQVETDFDTAYATFANLSCTGTLTGTLAGQILEPGVYCVDAVAKTGVLTLDAKGDANAVWIFLVDGALTGTNFSVVMANGATACNVYWWVKAATTMTTSDLKGTVLAGAAITTTDGTFEGRALAKAGVTLTSAGFVGCEGGNGGNGGNGGGKSQSKCNQGVGNGPESCDPGNSNQGNPFRSNDELGGVPGNPGRKGGNKK